MPRIALKDTDQANKKGIIFSLLVPLLQILDIYELPFAPVSFCEIVLIIFIVATILNRKLIIGSRIYLAFLFYSFIMSLLLGVLGRYLSFNDWFFKWARILVYSYLFFTLSLKYVLLDRVVDGFCFWGMFTSIAQILQVVIWRFFHRAIFLIIPGFRLHYAISSYSKYVENLMRWNGAGWRPSNFFLEPAQFAQFAVIVLICSMFLIPKPRFGIAIITTIAIFTSLSAVGIIMAVLLWGSWLIHVKQYNSIRYYGFAVVIIITAVIYLLNNEALLDAVKYRIGTVGEAGSTTGSLRLLRGLAIYKQLPVLLQVFGVGLGTLEQYLVNYNVRTIYDAALDAGTEYMNTLSYILVNTGGVGSIIFGAFVVSIVVKFKAYYQRIIILAWLILCAVTSNFLSIGYALPLLILFASNKSKGYNND